ncbi:hypothetical protein PCANB_001464 [Pneumocystis canis]|nr:hypothetical protein PCANB_001464 [Pneumocystis canis]
MNVFDTYDLEYIDLKRLESRTRYELALEEIFERYGKDMTEESDEVDLRTGEVIVNRGHLNKLRVSWFVGKETLNFNNDNLENDFFENILSLISINHRNTFIDHKKRRRTFPRKFPSKEQIFQQFGSLAPSIIKLIETQKRKRKQYFKKKRMPLKYSKDNKGKLYDSEIQEMSKLTTCVDSQMTSFKFQEMPINISKSVQSRMKKNFNHFFVQNNQNMLFNPIHSVRRFDIIIDCPKSNHPFIQYPKINPITSENALITKSMSIQSSPTRFFNQYYNFTLNSQKPTQALDNLSFHNNSYLIYPLSSELSNYQFNTDHSITKASIEQSTNSNTENSHQKKPHCNKMFCFTCSCL